MQLITLLTTEFPQSTFQRQANTNGVTLSLVRYFTTSSVHLKTLAQLPVTHQGCAVRAKKMYYISGHTQIGIQYSVCVRLLWCHSLTSLFGTGRIGIN